MGTGLFMAIMDVQIVTSSLTQIQGGLSASTDEIAWVQTAYLIADVVMVPMSGILSRLLSTRILFVVAELGFTGTSVLCATATNLGQMILYRAMQGFAGCHADRVAGRLRNSAAVTWRPSSRSSLL
jgi:DHA2 family multidrug resistance protein